MEVYLDNAATTRMDNRVFEEMLPYLKENYGNPSSAYKIGRNNKRIIERARKKVAEILNANPNEIYFTSGGSESDNMALKGIALGNVDKGKHIITSTIEHPAILDTCKELEREGFEISYIDVDNKGIVDLKKLEKEIRKDTILISIMFANNELGTIQPINEIGQIAKKYNILFHTDSVQAIGNIQIDIQKMNIDSLSLSAHKFYGPKGIGILRAIGASKRNISSIFNTETFIVGLFSGIMGIGITILLLIPINLIIHSFNTDITAVLPFTGGTILVILSVILTLIGGLIPSRKAAKQDPVTALRTE